MKIINGLTLKEMIISGANNLFNCYPEVDALNVFPVPDGDTGTNMNLTISSGAKEVQNRNDVSVYDISKAFSKGLLMGARGNSGVILSQIFRGFSISLEGKDVMTATDLADAFVSGKEVAYKAVMRPVEGTILTVIREASDLLAENVEENWSIEKCFEVLIKEAKASLKRTPDLLPVLKEVGVVDSGGTGLVKILEGFQQAILGHVVEKNMATVTENDSRMAGADVESDEFGYCTEFLLRIPEDPSNCGKKPFLEKRFTSTLLAHGNSIVVVRDEDIVKVHVHTLIPGYLLNYAQQFGEFVKIKVENMSEQHTELVNNGKDPAKKEKKEYGIIAVASGKCLEELFKEYRADYIVTGGQTMNPSTDDFVKAIQQVNAKKIFILPNNSNIIMAAEQACDIVEGVEVKVIPTKTIPQGLTACMMFNPEDDFSANVEEMTSSIDGVKSGQVTFAIKDTSFDGVEVKKDEFIGLSNKTIICSNPNKIETTIKTIESMIDDYSSIVTIIVGEDVSEEETNKLIEILESKYPDIEFDVKIGNQPVYSFIIGVE
ncbi:dAK2 domain protein [Firmicutes bacterium CAG:449]|nr:dAK2 domain protein [Firmicutes bacterium CAG:449]